VVQCRHGLDDDPTNSGLPLMEDKGFLPSPLFFGAPFMANIQNTFSWLCCSLLAFDTKPSSIQSANAPGSIEVRTISKSLVFGFEMDTALSDEQYSCGRATGRQSSSAGALQEKYQQDLEQPASKGDSM